MIRNFGTTSKGQPVQSIELQSQDLTVTILTWGAVLQSLRLGALPYDLTIGSGNLADYEDTMRYHGSLIGPVVNRITGASAMIDGKSYRFEANQDGRILRHCADVGTHLKVWDVIETGPSHAVLGLDLPDGEGGFPGNRVIRARFDLLPSATLRMTVTGTTDAPTLMNFANHSYWNLDGTETYAGHTLRIAADRYLPATPDFTPTGEIAPVEGTDYDFRTFRPIDVKAPHFDNNYCLSNHREPLRDVMWLRGASGWQMTLATTEPGLQVFDNRPVYKGLAVEAQFWPDAPNHPDFPSIALAPDEIFEQVTEWRFAKG